ncbi:MFS transporter [Eubacteriaceae bacterium ES2]|nr:MFS transporter [Eubacteriaceae bacterium ES2]
MRTSKKILAFIAIDIACFLTILDSTIVNVSLPSMATYFNTSTADISWVTTAYLIAFSSLLINFSKIADIYGRKKLFLIGLFLFGASSALCGLAPTLPLLVLFRIFQGIGAAILTPLCIPLGIELFGKQALGKLSVIVGLTISISAASGPVIGGLLNEFFNYRAIFYVNLPFVILSFVLAALYVIECYDESIEKKIDFEGSILLFIALGSLTFFLIKGNEFGWTSQRTLLLIGIFLISTILFLIIELKSKNPMIEFKLFQVKSYTSSIILIAVFFYAYMPISYLINFFFENTLGYSVLKTGLLMGIPSLTALLSTPLIPLLSKRLSAKTISFISISIAAIANLLLALMNPDNYMIIICIAFVLMGIGVRITTILYQTAYEEIETDKNGIASGIQNSLRQLTACIAIALVSTLSLHYTDLALVHTKTEMIREINDSQVLNSDIKSAVVSAVNNSTGSISISDAQQEINAFMMQNEENILATLPVEQQDSIKNSFELQVNALNTIFANTSDVKLAESYKVYNKCFLITGILTLFGLIAVPFNKKKEKISQV